MVSLEDIFPKLEGSSYKVTSPCDDKYNCIAWAAGDASKWWWPGAGGKEYWPSHAPRTETLDAFRQVFAAHCYSECTGEDLESDFEKIVIFADAAGLPLHAARQMPSGKWISKIGEREDIEHALHDLGGNEYGPVVQLMKRAVPAGAAENLL